MTPLPSTIQPCPVAGEGPKQGLRSSTLIRWASVPVSCHLLDVGHAVQRGTRLGSAPPPWSRLCCAAHWFRCRCGRRLMWCTHIGVALACCGPRLLPAHPTFCGCPCGAAGVGYGQPGKTFTIGLGCELRHTIRLVYSKGLDVLGDNAIQSRRVPGLREGQLSPAGGSRRWPANSISTSTAAPCRRTG